LSPTHTHTHFLDFIKLRIEEACDNNPALIRSRVAAEVYERLSVAIQRANADGVISWRYSEYGNAIYDTASDPVFAALNSETINLAECDRDLIRKPGTAAAAAERPVEAAEQTEAEEQPEEEREAAAALAGGPAGRVTSQVCRPGASEVHPETGADDTRLG